MKKFFISTLLFLTFFNGVASNGYKEKNLRDNHEATIEIESARIDQDSLQISWKITGVENIDQIILSVREITADGLINDPLELVSFSENGSEIISWDGATNLSLFLKIVTTEYTQYSGPDCESIFCYRDITTEITSEEFLINAIPDLPPVPTTILEEMLPEETPIVEITPSINFTNQLITTIPIFLSLIHISEPTRPY